MQLAHWMQRALALAPDEAARQEVEQEVRDAGCLEAADRPDGFNAQWQGCRAVLNRN